METQTIEIGLDTPINMLTPRQFFSLQKEWIEKEAKKIVENTIPASKPEKWYVNKIADLAKILKTSDTTIYRMKADGLLDEAISQYGRWMMIDVNKVLEIFRLSNRRKNKKLWIRQ